MYPRADDMRFIMALVRVIGAGSFYEKFQKDTCCIICRRPLWAHGVRYEVQCPTR